MLDSVVEEVGLDGAEEEGDDEEAMRRERGRATS